MTSKSKHPSLFFPVCEYYVHVECQDFAVADCKENATYLPGKNLSSVHHQHHWREGNLPSNSKCALCKKTCWTSECLSGYRCEWCGMTVRIQPCDGHRSSVISFSVTRPATSTCRPSARSAYSNRSTFRRTPSAFRGRRCPWRPSSGCKCAGRTLCPVSTTPQGDVICEPLVIRGVHSVRECFSEDRWLFVLRVLCSEEMLVR